MTEKKAKLSRRNFLVTVGAGGAATAAAIVAKNATPLQPPSAQERPGSSGYAATEHVNNYYRTAKV